MKMPKTARCIYCGYVGAEYALRSNYKCPKCYRLRPLGRQATLEDW